MSWISLCSYYPWEQWFAFERVLWLLVNSGFIFPKSLIVLWILLIFFVQQIRKVFLEFQNLIDFQSQCLGIWMSVFEISILFWFDISFLVKFWFLQRNFGKSRWNKRRNLNNFHLLFFISRIVPFIVFVDTTICKSTKW